MTRGKGRVGVGGFTARRSRVKSCAARPPALPRPRWYGRGSVGRRQAGGGVHARDVVQVRLLPRARGRHEAGHDAGHDAGNDAGNDAGQGANLEELVAVRGVAEPRGREEGGGGGGCEGDARGREEAARGTNGSNGAREGGAIDT